MGLFQLKSPVRKRSRVNLHLRGIEGILFLANYWKILEFQKHVKLDVEGLKIYLLPVRK